MGMSVAAAVKELQTREKFFVAYSQVTNLPYVTCDEESFNDQVWVFATEEEIKEFGKKKLEDKILLAGMRYEKKDFPRFYGTLYAIGVNSVIWNDGAEKVEVELEKIAKQADMSKVEPAKRPLFNPSLQLSAIYFMQELRRPVEMSQRQNMQELEEEVLANLCKSEFLLAMDVDPKDPKKINIPFVKDKKGNILQPIFTDVMEFEKFVRGKKLRMAKVPFEKLPGILAQQAKAIVVNPLGFNLVLNKEQIEKIIG